jgi:hypothetical protein
MYQFTFVFYTNDGQREFHRFTASDLAIARANAFAWSQTAFARGELYDFEFYR